MWHWKIVDTSLSPSEDDPPTNGGRTIAVAVWGMLNVPSSPENEDAPAQIPTTYKQRDFVPPELRLEPLNSLLGPLRAAGDEIMGKENPYLKLMSLCTQPEQQGRGAASGLLDWGTKKADDEGLVTYLDATAKARPVYEKRGFELVMALEWDREPWGGEGRDWHGCMVRQPKGKGR